MKKRRKWFKNQFLTRILAMARVPKKTEDLEVIGPEKPKIIKMTISFFN